MAATFALLTAASCHLALGLDDFTKANGSGGQGGSGGAGGAGGSGGAGGAGGMDCPACGPDDECGSYLCIAGVCEASYEAAGALCASGKCDGAGHCAGGTPLMARAFSDTGGQFIGAVRYDGAGNLLVSGAFEGTVDFGDGSGRDEVNAFALDLFIAKYNPGGGLLWKRALPTGMDGAAFVGGMEVDSNGNVIVVGYFRDGLGIGPGYTTSGDWDGMVIKLGGGDGAMLDHIVFSNIGDQFIQDLHIGDTGEVTLLAEYVDDDWTVPTSPSTTLVNQDNFDVALIFLDADLDPTDARSFGDKSPNAEPTHVSHRQHARRVVVDSSGNVIITGHFGGAISQTLPQMPLIAAGFDTFIIKQQPDGTTLFSKAFGSGPAADMLRGVKLDSQGNIWLAGYSDAPVDLGGGTLPHNGGSDVWVLQLSPQGEHMFSKSFGGPSTDVVRTFTIDDWDNLVLGVTSDGGLDLGGGVLPPAGGLDAIIAKFAFADNNLVHLWSATYGDGENQYFVDVTTNDGGAIAAGGWFQGVLAFNSATALTLVGTEQQAANPGVYDGFVATFAP